MKIANILNQTLIIFLSRNNVQDDKGYNHKTSRVLDLPAAVVHSEADGISQDQDLTKRKRTN